MYGGSAVRERKGWFFGLTGVQLGVTASAGIPTWLVMAAGAWLRLLVWVPVWVAVALLTCVPVRGWSAAQWVGVVGRFAWGRASGWSVWTSAVAAGDSDDLQGADLPGILSPLEFHDGPSMAGSLVRVAIIQDHARRTWAATARIAHPGLGVASAEQRLRMAAGLVQLCETASRSDLLSLLTFCVRTVPDDGAERDDWVRRHRCADAPAVSIEVTEQLRAALGPASVRREAFVTVVVAEERIRRSARRSGGGVQGRARLLYGLLGEVEARLLGGFGCTRVEWLDTAGLAAAIRTGFEPGDAVTLASARVLGRDHPDAITGVPLAGAGPAHAAPSLRGYRHGDWHSVTAAVLLPEQGAMLGALAPILVPSEVGERRSLTVFLRPVSRRTADRQTGRDEVAAAMGREMRRRVGKLERARDLRATQLVADTDTKLAHGRSLVRISAVASVTVPAGWDAGDYGRRLDASVRLAGFTPLALDGAHDAAFAAATIPVGVGPSRRGRS